MSRNAKFAAGLQDQENVNLGAEYRLGVLAKVAESDGFVRKTHCHPIDMID